VVGGGLLLFLGMPTAEQAAPLVLENIPAETTVAMEGRYWEAVSPVAVQYDTTRSRPVQLCGSCYGAIQAAPVVPVYMQYPQIPSCERQVPSPCAAMPCSSLPMYCGTPCWNTCPLTKPSINRNMELCVDECTFVQLHTTIPHPICSDMRFNWSTSKGSFLDPTSPDPMYYVPTTHFPDGEDVWVVVTITDGSGIQYTDQLKLHVVNQR